MSDITRIRDEGLPVVTGWRDMIQMTSHSYATYTVPANTGSSEGRIYAKIVPGDFAPLIQFTTTTSIPVSIHSVITSGSALLGNAPIRVPQEGEVYQLPEVTKISIYNPSSGTHYIGIELYK